MDERLVDLITQLAALLKPENMIWTGQERTLFNRTIRLAKRLEENQPSGARIR